MILTEKGGACNESKREIYLILGAYYSFFVLSDSLLFC